jgi:hypothetical protein
MPAEEKTDGPRTGGGRWTWDRAVNEVLGGSGNGPIDRGDLTGVTWIEHDVTWRDEGIEKGVNKYREPWKYNTELNVIHFYRWLDTGNQNWDKDNIIVRVRVNRDEYLPKWQNWSHGSYLAVLPFLDQRNHPVLDRQSMVDAANSFHLVEQWLETTGAMLQRQMDGIDTDASGFSGSAADVFHNNLFNLHRDMTDLHRDMSDKRLQGPQAWSDMLLGGADAIGEFGRDIRNAWYDKPNWIGPDGIIYGYWMSLPATHGPSLTENKSERSVYQAVLNSLNGYWETDSIDNTQFGLANWNVTFNLSLGTGDDPELIRTADILTAQGWQTVDQLVKLRWIKGIQADLDKVAEVLVPKLESRLETISLRPPTGVQDRPPGDPDGDGGGGGGGGGTPPPFEFEIPNLTPPPTVPPPVPPPFTLSATPPPGIGGGRGGGGGGSIGGVNGPGPNLPGLNGPGLGGGGGGSIGGPTPPRGPVTGGGNGSIGPVTGVPGAVPPGGSKGIGGAGGSIGRPGAGGASGSGVGRPGGTGLGAVRGGGSLGGPSAVNEQIGGLTATPFGGGLIGAAPDGAASYQDLAGLSAAAAARDMADRGADGSAGLGGYPFMPPMGGMGGVPNGGKEQERERKTWLTEDEEVWGTDPGVVSAVIGRDPIPDAEVETDVRSQRSSGTPGSPYAPTRTEKTRTARGRA